MRTNADWIDPEIPGACQNAGVPCATGATAEGVPIHLEQGFRIIITSPVKSDLGPSSYRLAKGTTPAREFILIFYTCPLGYSGFHYYRAELS